MKQDLMLFSFVLSLLFFTASCGKKDSTKTKTEEKITSAVTLDLSGQSFSQITSKDNAELYFRKDKGGYVEIHVTSAGGANYFPTLSNVKSGSVLVEFEFEDYVDLGSGIIELKNITDLDPKFYIDSGYFPNYQMLLKEEISKSFEDLLQGKESIIVKTTLLNDKKIYFPESIGRRKLRNLLDD